MNILEETGRGDKERRQEGREGKEKEGGRDEERERGREGGRERERERESKAQREERTEERHRYKFLTNQQKILDQRGTNLHFHSLSRHH